MLHGEVTVIMGSMYSGKSTRLLEKVQRADLGRRRFVLIKPSTDDRHSADHVVSHDGRRFPCTVAEPGFSILPLVPLDAERVFIDEAQFFGPALVNDVDELANRGVEVVVAGLDLDFRARPFPIMVELAFQAEHVEKLLAICDVCGTDSHRSQRVSNGEPTMHGDVIQVGGVEAYEPRCRSCYEVTEYYEPASLEATQGAPVQ